ncbi:MAG TPA: hypothetical protein DDX84_06710 [Nitrospiraceae bacterium]|nr:hypothetical protein [Nitrospiraceae bacterium]
MPLSLSKKSSFIAQSDIRVMTLECARVGGINLAQCVCDTEVLLSVYLKHRIERLLDGVL